MEEPVEPTDVSAPARWPVPAATAARDRELLRAFGDPIALGVLAALSRGELDAHAVVLETGLPQSSVYRKLRELASQGLVGVSRFAFTPEGRKVELFVLQVRGMYVWLEGGAAQVHPVFRRDSSHNLDAMWTEVRRFGR
ncbi:MAG: helix-turn-helix domain-containing protein [Thermoplasmata archaeon]|nr:helix-turn-helix domain-containing protein [Thermoplasmata archaeon]MCI4342386.1 helix-turn-helix domain-containing protein [Thermoplasmata archaeon]